MWFYKKKKVEFKWDPLIDGKARQTSRVNKNHKA
jgi:hypothetical protein